MSRALRVPRGLPGGEKSTATRRGISSNSSRDLKRGRVSYASHDETVKARSRTANSVNENRDRPAKRRPLLKPSNRRNLPFALD